MSCLLAPQQHRAKHRASMPKTAQAKRGRESANPAVAAALAPEEPPEAEELAPAEETPAQRARKMFKVKVEEAAPSAKHSGGGMSCVLEGVVMRCFSRGLQVSQAAQGGKGRHSRPLRGGATWNAPLLQQCEWGPLPGGWHARTQVASWRAPSVGGEARTSCCAACDT